MTKAGAAPNRPRALASALVQAVRLISASTHDLDATLDALTTQAKLVLRADTAALTFVDADGWLVVRRVPVDVIRLEDRISVGSRVRPGELTREAIEARRPVFSEDFQTDPRVDDESRWRSPGVVAAAVIPLVADQEVLGLLALGWTRPFTAGSAALEVASTAPDATRSRRRARRRCSPPWRGRARARRSARRSSAREWPRLEPAPGSWPCRRRTAPG
jgi:hypothetical protein